MLFLLPHLEDRDTHSNLGTERNVHEEDANSSEEENRNGLEIFERRSETKFPTRRHYCRFSTEKNGGFKCR
jgi:hypothetical protein